MRTDYLKVLLATVLFGSFLVASKLIVREVPVFVATFVRLASAAVILGIYVRSRGIRLPRLSKRDVLVLVVQATLGMLAFEAVRWDMDKDIPWDSFDPTQLTDEQATTIKMNAITEWSALPATEMFLRDNRDDSDFCAFMSVWFFEEQKHSLVLMEYLRRFRPELVPTEEELHAVRFEFDPAPALETLMLHFCGEIRLNHWYRRAANGTPSR
jgi:hypothetical protein